MPSQPTWFHRLDEILEELQTLASPFLDRRTVETLFRVRQRRARQIMADLPAFRIGNALAVERLALLSKLQGVAQSEECQREQDRRGRVSEHLNRVRKDLAARRIRIPVTAEPGRLKGLPGSVELLPGELRIRFSTAEDLAVKLFELSQAMANDWPQFQETLDGHSLP